MQKIIEEFKNSEICKRIKQIETFYNLHGFPFYQGQTIPEWLEEKLKSLADRVSGLNDKTSGSKKEKIEAVVSAEEIPNPQKVHSDFYPYMSKPSVTILPNGIINITFGNDWMTPEKENFLVDMKVKALKKGKR